MAKAGGAIVAGASKATAAIMTILVVRAVHARRAFTARTPVLFRAPTGLAVGLARKESRYDHPPPRVAVLVDSPPRQGAPLAPAPPLVSPPPRRPAARDPA